MYEIRNVEKFKGELKNNGYRLAGIQDIPDTENYIIGAGGAKLAILSIGGNDNEKTFVTLLTDRDEEQDTVLLNTINKYGSKFDISI